MTPSDVTALTAKLAWYRTQLVADVSVHAVDAKGAMYGASCVWSATQATIQSQTASDLVNTTADEVTRFVVDPHGGSATCTIGSASTSVTFPAQ